MHLTRNLRRSSLSRVRISFVVIVDGRADDDLLDGKSHARDVIRTDNNSDVIGLHVVQVLQLEGEGLVQVGVGLDAAGGWVQQHPRARGGPEGEDCNHLTTHMKI